MNVFRLAQFGKIDKDQLNRVIEEQLSVHHQFKMNEISYHFLISTDLDRPNAEKRKLLYHKKRDIAMKLCKSVPDALEEHEPFSREDDPLELKQYIIFDIRLSLNNEDIPDQIFKCLRYSRMKNEENQKYFPKFLDLTRCDMQIQLQLSKHNIMLREIIGDRTKMLKMASSITV
jgi:hypothetical protein